MLDYETRVKMIKEALIEVLKADDDLFVQACEELDSWNGFLDDDRCYEMDMIDDILGDKKPSEMIKLLTNDFDSSCEWFYFSIYGLESCDDKTAHYRDNYYESDVLESLINNYNNISAFDNMEFEAALELLSYDDEETIMDDNDNMFLKGLESLKESAE